MFKFEYNIELNDEGTPFINPINDTVNELDFIEHKFMSIEISRSIITSTINIHKNDSIKFPISEFELNRLKYLESELTHLSVFFGSTIKDQFRTLGIADKILNNNFDVSVLTIEERNDLNYNGIIFNDKIFKRVEGLKVKIIKTGEIFELIGGIDNEHWKLKQ